MRGNILYENKAKTFVEHCKNMFDWKDLSNDVIMDVGCGEAGYCGKGILEKFPVVGSLIFIDNNPKEIRDFQLQLAANMECVLADIEKRETLRNYAGKIDKVISTYVFHALMEKEVAFRNVYDLLKPGGEAAFVLVKKSLLYEWLTELQKKPKWKKAFKNPYPESEFQSEFGAHYYREMVERIGFLVVECEEVNVAIPYPSEEDCKASLHQISSHYFNIPSAAIEEFEEDGFQALVKSSPRDDAGNPCYRTIEVNVLLTKPKEGCASKAK